MNFFKEKNSEIFSGLALSLFLIGVAVFGRLIDHAPNFAPVAAMGLFAGLVLFSARKAYILVVVSMLISDLIIGFDSVFMRGVVYSSMIFPVMMGSFLKHKTGTSSRLKGTLFVAGGSVAGSAVFFLTTNAAVWFQGHLYPMNGEGLMMSYFYAIPFFKYTLAGDLFYSALFFTLYGFSKTAAQYIQANLNQGFLSNQTDDNR